MTGKQGIWKSKVAAWVHDPAEKALVLLRDPAGHEGGTVAELCRCLFGKPGIPDDIKEIVKKADQWAAAADRPQFPRESDGGRFQSWTQVDFAKEPVLVHPLAGNHYYLRQLEDVAPDILKPLSFDHLVRLVARDANEEVDWRRTALQLWRLGPEISAEGMGALWACLPADTRVPDHSIWEHLRMTSALTGAFANGGTPALLSMSFGPVQSFIAQARSTSDLWAGSHLLSSIAWEGMRVICEAVGPDAIIFPDLHGVPVVDLWLQENGVLVPDDAEWLRARSDANPLFAAALPNRFVAVVPHAEAKELVDGVTTAVRGWVKEQATRAWKLARDSASDDRGDASDGISQINTQLEDFPEVHWSVVPWDLVSKGGEAGSLQPDRLGDCLRCFYPSEGVKDPPGFLGSTAWKLLSKALEVEGAAFYRPNPGTLYPALYDLLDRSAAAAKSARPFEQVFQEGYRCSLCGEREWLTDDRALLARARGQTGSSDVWEAARRRGATWARRGEHLCALCALKRLWPAIFAEGVRHRVPDLGKLQRYVVSTHTMALASTFRNMIGSAPAVVALERFADVAAACEDKGGTALPRSLVRKLKGVPEELGKVIRRLPTALDDLRERASDGDESAAFEYEALRKAVEKISGVKPEAYYALVLMDGDSMGAWLSSTGECRRLEFGKLWHPGIRSSVEEKFGESEDMKKYLAQEAPPSPSYHAAISRALNGFALHAARAVVEDLFQGKVIYSGGDDLLAMMCVDDLLGGMLALRCAYSGLSPGGEPRSAWRLLTRDEPDFRLGGGHLWFDRRRRLLRMMGARATASMGAVVAHHMAPLGMVLRELRAAERRAKDEGGRDAFSISLVKRSGSITHLTSRWHLQGVTGDPGHRDVGPFRETAPGVLLRLRDAFANDLSRRAAYHVLSWLPGMPGAPDSACSGQVAAIALSEESYRDMLVESLAYQMRRQRKNKDGDAASFVDLAGAVVDLALTESRRRKHVTVPGVIEQIVTVSEFLAREGRVERSEASGGDHE